jgi:lipopolysaccharide transport system ATP-binding protein
VVEPVVSVNAISKRYRIGEHGPNSMPRPVRRIVGRMLGRKSAASSKDRTFWALDKVTFDVMPGDRIGIVGRNGAGKSTLLKILSRVVPPTSGEATIRGRLTSLLEVGTGFNDNLSGRENVYLNASLHGLVRDEIDARFDDIVAFSEIGEFIDTPVNHYSSGMRARLAFAVAAHLEPDIMMLDEVLAVGDLAFQRKCLARMENIMEGGRALLFVSHSIDDIRRYCDKAIWLEKGKLVMAGSAVEVTEAYAEAALKLQSAVKVSSISEAGEKAASPSDGSAAAFDDAPTARFISARIVGADGAGASVFTLDQEVVVEMEFVVDAPGLYVPSIALNTPDGIRVFGSIPSEPNVERHIRNPGQYRTRAVIPAHFLNVGTYHVTLGVTTPTATPLKRHIHMERALSFYCVEAQEGTSPARGLMPRQFPGVIRPLLRWSHEEVAPASEQSFDLPA